MGRFYRAHQPPARNFPQRYFPLASPNSAKPAVRRTCHRRPCLGGYQFLLQLVCSGGPHVQRRPALLPRYQQSASGAQGPRGCNTSTVRAQCHPLMQDRGDGIEAKQPTPQKEKKKEKEKKGRRGKKKRIKKMKGPTLPHTHTCAQRRPPFCLGSPDAGSHTWTHTSRLSPF